MLLQKEKMKFFEKNVGEDQFLCRNFEYYKNIKQRKMDKIILKLKDQNDWQIKFQEFNLKNNLVTNPISRLQDDNIEALMKHMLKLAKQEHSKHIISWASTEYQVLEIVLNSLSVIASKIIKDFSGKQWEQVYLIFPYKLPLTIKYEGIRIAQEKKQPRRRWCSAQENLLIEIVKKSLRKNKWNDVARELFIKSDGCYFRQGKHCRQRWLNHLHPAIQNNSWSKEEDLILLSFVLKKGRKWAAIAKKFGMVRSECMINKRFHQLIKIEEQKSCQSDWLRNQIRIAMEGLNEELKMKKNVGKENNQFQYKNDNNEQKCISEEKSGNIKKQDEISEWKRESLMEKIPEVSRTKELTHEMAFNPCPSILNPIHAYYCPPIQIEYRVVNTHVRYPVYREYPTYVPASFNSIVWLQPFYSYQPQIILQNSIHFHQGFENPLV